MLVLGALNDVTAQFLAVNVCLRFKLFDELLEELTSSWLLLPNLARRSLGSLACALLILVLPFVLFLLLFRGGTFVIIVFFGASIFAGLLLGLRFVAVESRRGFT